MIYFLYWTGIFILALSLCLIFKLGKSEEEDLPFSEEQIFQVLVFLLGLGFIIIASTLPFINYKINSTKMVAEPLP